MRPPAAAWRLAVLSLPASVLALAVSSTGPYDADESWPAGPVPYVLTVAADIALAPPQPADPHRCSSCCRSFPLLVEGTDLCMDCDSLMFPAVFG